MMYQCGQVLTIVISLSRILHAVTLLPAFWQPSSCLFIVGISFIVALFRSRVVYCIKDFYEFFKIYSKRLELFTGKLIMIVRIAPPSFQTYHASMSTSMARPSSFVRIGKRCTCSAPSSASLKMLPSFSGRRVSLPLYKTYVPQALQTRYLCGTPIRLGKLLPPRSEKYKKLTKDDIKVFQDITAGVMSTIGGANTASDDELAPYNEDWM